MSPVKSLLVTALALPVLGANLLVSHYSGSIYSLSLDMSGAKGTLAIKQTLKVSGGMPSWLTLDGTNLYVSYESGNSPVVTQISVGSDGTLTAGATTTATQGGSVHSALYGGADGRSFIAVAQYGAASIGSWSLPASSSTAVSQFKFTMNGAGPVASRQDTPHPHSVYVDPSGQFLLSADLGADVIRVFSIDATSGKLTSCANVKTGAGDGPRHMAWYNSTGAGQMLFVVNELGNSVSSWKVTTPAAGACLAVTHVQTLSTYAPGKTGPQGCKAAEVHVSGDFVYAVNRNDKTFGATQDSVATYSIDAASGQMAWVEATSAYGYYPRTFAINKAGDMVAFGGQTSSTVSVVQRSVSTGKLGPLVATLQVGSPGTPGSEDGLSAVVWNE